MGDRTENMTIALDSGSVDDYRTFLRVKALPTYRVIGPFCTFQKRYAAAVGMAAAKSRHADYNPTPGLFDYQRDIAQMAIDRGKFSVFADCGLGKTFIMSEFAREATRRLSERQCTLIVSPLMVIPQTLAEVRRFYNGDLPIRQLRASELPDWLMHGTERIGITNYEAMTDELRPGRIGALILDESSMLKSHYGKWGRTCVRLGRGLQYKLAGTGTPAPNDRIEYANHAVMMDAFPTINSFLSRFFVNRGQTDNRWELKPHAIGPFYRALSDWSIFLTNPAVYGWKDNTDPLPPIHVHEHHVPLTDEQQGLAFGQTGQLFAHHAGGITSRSVLSQIAKGHYEGRDIETLKPRAIRRLVESWPDESTLIWCIYNAEQRRMVDEFPGAASIDGATPYDVRHELIDDFKAGRRRVMISKPKVLGFGLNLHVATRQVFSGMQDSYESYYQAVKRSNRYGATRPLNVHIPYTDIERPMIDTVLEKAGRVQADTEEQERIFRDNRM